MATVAATAICAGAFVLEAAPRTVPSPVSSSRPATPVASPVVRTFVDVVEPAPPVDAVATYPAMRDDLNPIPRLHHLEASARDAPRAVDPLSHAMTDADAAVRERAQVLFDRFVTTPVPNTSADAPRPTLERKFP